MTKLLRSTTQQNAPLSIMGHFKVLTIVFVSLFLTSNTLLAQTWIRTYDFHSPVGESLQPITLGDTTILFMKDSVISRFNNIGDLKSTINVPQASNKVTKTFGWLSSIDNQNIILARVEYSSNTATEQTLKIVKIPLNGQPIGDDITINLPTRYYLKPSLIKLNDAYLISDDLNGFLIKINESGTILWTANTNASLVSDKPAVVLANQNILRFALNNSTNNRTAMSFIEISPINGQIVDSAVISIPKYKGTYSQIIPTKDNGVVLLRNITLSYKERQIVASKIDLKRRYLENQSFSPMKDTIYEDAFQAGSDTNGNIYVAGSATTDLLFVEINQVYVFAFTPNATFRDHRFYSNFMANGNNNRLLALQNLTVTPTGRLYLGGGSITQNFVIRLDSFGVKFPTMRTRILRDNNGNCQADNDDTPLSNWLIQADAKKLRQSFFQTSDSLGYVNFGGLPIDTYRIKAVTPPNLLWQNCYVSTVFFDRTRDTIISTLVAQPLVNCPVMQTDVTIPILRRCFENTIYVSYLNGGVTTAQNARITVKLDSLMEYVSATRPLSSRVGNLLTFEIGDVPESAYNRFNITARVRCGDSTRLGQTLCVEARAYPDTLCTPISTTWTGANIAVSSSCQNDSIYFYIKNTGRGTTATGIHYIVIEDDIVFMQGTTPILIPNASKLIRLPATGKTYRVVADQEINHPLSESQPTVAVEGCVSNGQSFTTGFVNQFTESDEALSLDIECREVRGAFDPNDKTGLPKGYDNQHFIQKGNDIEYMIRFQNTGTDTAFTVIVRDTLPYNQLDPTTVKVGASSHSYKWQLMDKGVLEFRFDNIMLPDSFTNKLGSNGFVKFRISQKANLAESTKIENRAGIYFDFNTPVITNRTLHTIATTYKTQLRLDNDEVTAAAKIRIAPNPFGEQTVIDITESTPSVKTGIFELFDLNGKLLRHEKFENNRFEFYKKDLPTGFYIFKISTVDGRLIGQGKVVAQ